MNDFEWTKDSNLEEGEAWKSVVKTNNFSPAMYRKYMEIVHSRIKRVEDEMKQLERLKKRSKLTYEEWLVLHDGIKK